MDFSKIPHPVNFNFKKTKISKRNLENLHGGIFRLRVPFSKESKRPFDLKLSAVTSEIDSGNVSVFGNLKVQSKSGAVLLEGAREGFFGTSRDQWIMRFESNANDSFYGLGAQSGKFDRTGTRAQMWNVDAWGAHGVIKCKEENPMPLYANIPFLLIRNGNEALGILVNDAGRVFFSLSPDMRLHPSQEPVKGSSFYLGSSGPADVFFILGNSPADVIQKFGKISGPQHVPPLWALGYQQSRWGYAGTKDLNYLDSEMSKRKIPCDGLFLDIDYMDRYKVFTTSDSVFKDAKSVVAKIAANGRHVIPILDPGVRDESDYEVRDDGMRKKIFCKNPNGDFYRGYVWPGATLFPDFSLKKVQNWWAERVAKLSANGFEGYWVDMNDPSTGSVTDDEMLFENGKKPHESFHNLFANGMAEATFKGLKRAFPGKSPFILSRSASLGMGRFAGVWLGDNFSTWKSLAEAIPMAMSLSISGVSLVGADIGGYGEDSNGELLARWAEAAVLFPFFRIHSAKNCIPQEPWRFGKKFENRIVHAIRTRYRLLPELYRLFEEANQTGAPVMRPLFYLGKDASSISKARLEDEYLIGDSIVVAPIIEAGKTSRSVELPNGEWIHFCSHKKYRGGKAFRYTPKEMEIGIFVKRGATLLETCETDIRSSADIDLSKAKKVVY